jgi:hypothetical protein
VVIWGGVQRWLGVLPAAAFALLVVGVTLVSAGWFAHLVRAPVAAMFCVSLAIAATAAGAVGGVPHAAQWRAWGSRARERDVLSLSGALVGPVVWAGVALAALVVPRASAQDWALRGDSVNEITFARELLRDGGLRWGPEGPPVPLPHTLIAFLAAPARDGQSASSLVARDFATYVTLWHVVICMLGAMTGLVAWLLMRRAGIARFGALWGGSALLSTAILTWFVTGYAAEFGFFNTHLALIVVLALMAVVIAEPHRPAVVVVVAAWSSMVMLATWSPLVLVTLALGVPALLAWLPRVRRQSAAVTAATLVSLGALGAYVVFISLPLAMSKSSVLGAPGGFLAFPRWVMPLLAVIAVVLARIAAGVWRHRLVALVAGTAFALHGALVAVLFLGGGLTQPWSYYPLKLAWTGEILLAILAVVAALIAVERVHGKVLKRLGRSVVVLGAVGGLVGLPVAVAQESVSPTYRDPVTVVLSGTLAGGDDAIARHSIALASDGEIRLLWRSGEPAESAANLWTLLLAAESLRGVIGVDKSLQMRDIAYSLDSSSVSQPCDLAVMTDLPVLLVTRDASLGDQAANECTIHGGNVEVEER